MCSTKHYCESNWMTQHECGFNGYTLLLFENTALGKLFGKYLWKSRLQT